MGVPLTEAVEARVLRMFAGDDLEPARQLIREDCVTESTTAPADLDRVRLAALKISRGTLQGLVEAIVLVQTDWRDALMTAGFGHDVHAHREWWPG